MDLNIQGEAGGNITVSDQVFAAEYKPALVHQIVTAFMAGGRAGTKAQKSRSDVSGGGAKPWRQKGTGRARAGTSRSPIWRSGGVTFAARPKDYSQKVNRKMYRGALRSMLSELLRQDRIIVVNDFTVNTPKTKSLVAKMKELELKDVIVIVENPDENLYLASRNLYGIEICDVNEMDPGCLIAYDKVLFSAAAIKKIEERLV